MTRLLLITALTLSAASCLGDEPPRGFDSPEAAIRAYARAAAAEDYGLLFATLTPEAQVRHLALSVVTAAALHGDDRTMQLILDRHLPPLPVSAASESTPDAQRRLLQAMWAVPDRVRFVTEIAARHEELFREATAADASAKNDRLTSREANLRAAADVGLDRLEYRNDTATAIVTLPPLDGVLAAPQRMAFRRIDGRWFCDDDPE